MNKSLQVLTLMLVMLMPAFAENKEKNTLDPLAQYEDGFFDQFVKKVKKIGDIKLNMRLSYENSSLNNGNSPGKGLNLRTRISYRTPTVADTNLFIQLQDVSNFIEQYRFGGVKGGQRGRDVIADPDGARFHQLYIDNHSFENTLIRIGRQEIILDDARLVGNIGWRQQAQSFDGILVQNKSIKNLVLTAAFLKQINTIFNTTVDLDNFIIAHATYQIAKKHKISTFLYLLDFKNSTRDSKTYGTRLWGDFGLIDYDVTYAKQDDYAEGRGHDGQMINLFVGVDVTEKSNVGIGYSRLSGANAGNRGFDTLVSTAHKFNGWADQFLATNGGGVVNGLEDLYFQAKTKCGKTVFLARYHMFSATENNPGKHSGSYGNEFDFLIKRPITKYLTGLLKYAYYNQTNNNGGTNPTADEQVFWARLELDF